MKELPANTIRQSQKAWRNLDRGILSRPQEIPALSPLIDRSIKHVFQDYISSDHPSPIVAWSVLQDEPSQSPVEYEYELRLPSEIDPRDEGDYIFRYNSS